MTASAHDVAAVVAVVRLILVAVFQLALALGAPWVSDPTPFLWLDGAGARAGDRRAGRRGFVVCDAFVAGAVWRPSPGSPGCDS